MKKLAQGFTLACCAAFGTLAQAVPLTGGVSFSSTDATNFVWDATADTFDFGTGIAAVDSATGDFASVLSPTDTAYFYNFSYGAGFIPTTVWTAKGLKFELDSILDVKEYPSISGGETSMASVSGMGTLSDVSDSTAAYWNMTVNTAGTTFSWSSSTGIEDINVPEPATMGLFMLCFAALCFFRKTIYTES